jgi:signal peptidase I
MRHPSRAAALGWLVAALAAVIAGVAMTVAAPAPAALPSDPAGVPFQTFADAAAGGDYSLACRQLAVPTLMRTISPRPATLGAARATCARALAEEVEGLDEAWRSSLASTRVVAVRVRPGRARVTVQTTLYGIEPRSTGTAVVEHRRWKIGEAVSDAHVGRSLVMRMPSESMLPTLAIGDTILVDQDAYVHAQPRVGDIVVLRPPAGAEGQIECGRRPPPGQACAIARSRVVNIRFVKRIVAGPGDRISIRDGYVVRNGARAPESFVAPCLPTDAYCDFPRTFPVPMGRYYTLGDNRGASDDSRFWGPVAAAQIIGRVARLGP